MSKRKKSDDVSLDALDPFELTASPEHIGILRRGLAKLEHRKVIWTAVLEALEKQAGITALPIPKPMAYKIGATVDADNAIRKGPRKAPPTQPRGPLKLVEGSGTDVLYKVLVEAAGPIAYYDVAERYEKAGGPSMKNRQTLYAAIQRLKNKGYCVPYKGRIATPDNLKKFLEDVAAGRVKDLGEHPRFQSRWADAIADYLLERNEWVRVAEITEHFSTLPDFRDNKHILVQICATLNKMRTNHVQLVEKQGRANNARWRMLRDKNGAAHADIGAANVVH
jgi:hypothetical protein